MKKHIAFTLPNPIHMGGESCGYVAIPMDHPCAGMDYWDIEEKYRINVHGGLTFSEIEIYLQPEETKGMYILGFDTAHSGDTLEQWPDAAVMIEAEELKRQLEIIYLNGTLKRCLLRILKFFKPT